MRVLLLCACVASGVLAGAGAGTAATDPAGPGARSVPVAYPWAARVRQAQRFAAERQGRIGFAVIDESGQVVGGRRLREGFSSASVVKVVMMVCYLNHRRNRTRRLTSADWALLDPMIRRSADEPANHIYGAYGPACLERAARRLGMTSFSTQTVWGRSQVTPLGVARMFRRVRDQLPPRHRRYGMGLLAHVVPSQRWGLPPARPNGWTIRFKGGWAGSRAGGRVVNQGALFEHGGRRFSMAVLTDRSPSHEYGTSTIRGIGLRLLRGYE